MTLSPSDVEQKTFSTALRGYDLDEVDDFLDEVVSTIRELNDQIEAASATPSAGPVEAPVSEPEPAPEPTPPADETAVGRALIAAQETADKIVADAREEAERILAEARTQADDLVAAREQQRAEAEAEMAELTQHVAGVRSRLAVLATEVANRLDEMDEAIVSEPGELPDADGVDTETGVIGGDAEDVVEDSPVVDADETGEEIPGEVGEQAEENLEETEPGEADDADDDSSHGIEDENPPPGWG